MQVQTKILYIGTRLQLLNLHHNPNIILNRERDEESKGEREREIEIEREREREREREWGEDGDSVFDNP